MVGRKGERDEKNHDGKSSVRAVLDGLLVLCERGATNQAIAYGSTRRLFAILTRFYSKVDTFIDRVCKIA